MSVPGTEATFRRTRGTGALSHYSNPAQRDSNPGNKRRTIDRSTTTLIASEKRDAEPPCERRQTVILNSHAIGFLSDSPRRHFSLPPFTPFPSPLSLSLPPSLPVTAAPLAKSFPCFPFLFGLLMWCLECRREEGREGEGVSLRVRRSPFITSQHLCLSRNRRNFTLDNHLFMHSTTMQEYNPVGHQQETQQSKKKQLHKGGQRRLVASGLSPSLPSAASPRSGIVSVNEMGIRLESGTTRIHMVRARPDSFQFQLYSPSRL